MFNPNIGTKLKCANETCPCTFYEYKGKSNSLPDKLKGKYKFNAFSVCKNCGREYCDDCYQKGVRHYGCKCGNGINDEKHGFGIKIYLEKL